MLKHTLLVEFPPKSLGNTNLVGDRIDPYEITGSWSVRISEEGSNTVVNVTASNLNVDIVR